MSPHMSVAQQSLIARILESAAYSFAIELIVTDGCVDEDARSAPYPGLVVRVAQLERRYRRAKPAA